MDFSTATQTLKHCFLPLSVCSYSFLLLAKEKLQKVLREGNLFSQITFKQVPCLN